MGITAEKMAPELVVGRFIERLREQGVPFMPVNTNLIDKKIEINLFNIGFVDESL